MDRLLECRLTVPLQSVAHVLASRYRRRRQSFAAGAKDRGPGRVKPFGGHRF